MPQSSDNELADGLMRFYSSQADVMLAQYRNINDLLGPTSHHTHPGTHCEILLRNCLRSFLPPGWSADKGFIYGRVNRSGISSHSPEIDILIHEESHRRPLFRVDDFVIVHPKSVIGMIEVKKNFDGDQLNRGVTNVVAAKQHLFDLHRDTGTGKLRIDRFPFSAVIGFEGTLSDTGLQSCLRALQDQNQAYERPNDQPWSTSILVSPDLVGTFSGLIAISDQGANRAGYELYNSVQGGTNIALQLLLWKLARAIPEFHMASQPLAFPTGIQPEKAFVVGTASE